MKIEINRTTRFTGRDDICIQLSYKEVTMTFGRD